MVQRSAPGERIECRHRLIQQEELRLLAQRHDQRHLGLLAAGELFGLPVERDAKVLQSAMGKSRRAGKRQLKDRMR